MQPDPFIVFLDENHCNNPKLLAVLQEADVQIERHLDHFPRGTPDEVWLPFVGQRGWILLTTDMRIRYRSNEKRAVEMNLVRMFYFSNNNMSGQQMATALTTALPRIIRICQKQEPPFCAAITRSGAVEVRVTF